MENKEILENEAVSNDENHEEIKPETSLHDFTDGNSFKKASEKYSDNMSTAITFFVCGIAGIIVLILNQLRVIKLFETSGPSFIFKIIIFGGLFTAFIIIGIYSLKAAKKAKAKIKEETDISDTVMEWLRNNVTIDDIDNSYEDTDIADEMKYFNRTAYIKELIKSKFEEIDDELRDVLADDFFEELYK